MQITTIYCKNSSKAANAPADINGLIMELNFKENCMEFFSTCLVIAAAALAAMAADDPGGEHGRRSDAPSHADDQVRIDDANANAAARNQEHGLIAASSTTPLTMRQRRLCELETEARAGKCSTPPPNTN